jgi:hypothetical protein
VREYVIVVQCKTVLKEELVPKSFGWFLLMTRAKNVCVNECGAKNNECWKIGKCGGSLMNPGNQGGMKTITTVTDPISASSS